MEIRRRVTKEKLCRHPVNGTNESDWNRNMLPKRQEHFRPYRSCIDHYLHRQSATCATNSKRGSTAHLALGSAVLMDSTRGPLTLCALLDTLCFHRQAARGTLWSGIIYIRGHHFERGLPEVRECPRREFIALYFPTKRPNGAGL